MVLGCSIPRLLYLTLLRHPKNRYLRKCGYAKEWRFENLRLPHPNALSEVYLIRFQKVLPPAFLQLHSSLLFVLVCSGKEEKEKKKIWKRVESLDRYFLAFLSPFLYAASK
ncbi:hypothetical protein CEXT_653421 [Caerostris extrusa]|uniref:Uncharacterized protein n=1 Tax=Caerostris extrusa TaxID=172846 RepID=A0AAV4WFN9_CAEEX|nr:hypothetical protein CEXT_653421 [Caerostris extrusa]